jgi:hypothetical protein
MTAGQAELVQAIRAQLHERAETASPPSDAWDRFVGARSLTVEVASQSPGAADVAAVSLPIELGINERSSLARPKRWRIYGVAAACVAATIVGVVLFGDGHGQPMSDDTTRATTREPIEAERATAVIDDYFTGLLRGDLQTTMALFAPNATFTSGGESLTRNQFEVESTWAIARGVTYIDRECTAADAPDGMEVTCTYGELEHLRDAVGAPPVDITLTALITDAGITRLATEIIDGSTVLSDVDSAFDRWVLATHPADPVAMCCDGATVDEARHSGELRAQYADDFAAYLVAHGCTFATYDEACPAAIENVAGPPLPPPTAAADNAGESLLRSLADLGPGDIVIPTALPEGWTFGEPAQLHPDEPADLSFAIRQEDPPQGISLRLLQNEALEIPTVDDNLDIAGVAWSVEEQSPGSPLLESRWVARVDSAYIEVRVWGTVDRAFVEDFLAGLRVGPESEFPAALVVFGDDGSVVARSGLATTTGEVVASSDPYRVRAVRLGDWVCWSMSGADPAYPRAGDGCRPLASLEPNDIAFGTEYGDTDTMVIVGVVSGSGDQVTVRVADTRIVVPTGGPNDVVDRQFFVTELSGALYERLKATGVFDVEVIG